MAYMSSLMSLEHGGISGWLEELYVLPAWRGRGIGTRLLARAVLQARRLGWKAVDLEVDRDHRRAEALYPVHGFSRVPRRRFCLALS